MEKKKEVKTPEMVGEEGQGEMKVRRFTLICD
jgi:hypothetical protein